MAVFKAFQKRPIDDEVRSGPRKIEQPSLTVEFVRVRKRYLRVCVIDHDCLPYRPHSSSASRFTAGAAGFFILSQSGERPER